MTGLNESIVEDAALSWFGEWGYAIGHGPDMAPGEVAAERGTCNGTAKVSWVLICHPIAILPVPSR